MKIQLQTEGGFAYIHGFIKPFILDSVTLSTQDAEQLQKLVEEINFFTLPSEQPPAHRADYQQYTITIEDGQHQHQVKVYDPVRNPDLQKLLTFLQTHKALSH